MEKEEKIISGITLDEMRSVIDGLDMVVFMTDLVSRKMLFMSAGCEKIYGVPAQAFYDNPDLWLTFFPSDEKEAIANVMQEWSKGKSATATHRIVRADGGVRWVEARTMPIVDAHGTVIRITGFLTDITKRKIEEADSVKMRQAIQTSFDAVLETDVQGIITYVNDAFVTLYGYQPEEVIGKVTPRILNSGTKTKEQFKEFWDTLLRKQNMQWEIVNKTKEGKLVVIDANANSILDSSGNIAGFIEFQKNITDQKSAENALISSKKELSLAVELAKIAPWRYDSQKNVFVFGDEFYALYGTSVEKEGATMTPEAYTKKFVHPDDASIMNTEIGKAMQSPEREQIIQLESRIIRLDGEVRDVSVLLKITKDDNGEIIDWYGVNQDITEQKTREFELTIFRESMKQTLDIVYIMDTHEIITEVNDAFLEAYGYQRDEVVGKMNGRTLSGMSESDFDPLAKEFYAKGKLHTQVVGKLKDGKSILLDTAITLVVDGRGAPIAILVAQRDVSERERQITRIKELNDLRMKFIQIVSHQLRTPLGSIRWNLEVLMDGSMGVLTDAQKQFLRVTYNADVEVLDRINDLLVVIDIEENRVAFMKENISIESLLNSVVGELKPRCMAKELTCNFHIPEVPLDPVSVDPQKMRQVFVKLIENAITYTLEKGSIEGALTKIGDRIRFELTDTGIGIPVAEQKNIFLSFVRGTNAFLAKPDSTGVGLTIAKYFVEQHGGTIGFTSEEGKGSTFWFEIPIVNK
ncbi:MAG: multi-sensor hybrid histidine kinase [uncultured bacterium]|uniref:histidine kinase n=2 Tax=Candidatus Wolfeibacteriota TaxID=1752735 RepID=A0A0G1HAD7_9BACT|nr:MAG: multi-sensor hybrid histidine kinase [uncultured bacterium]KKR12789.1 MAG: PAS domain S-box [Candidatus Wolfebacteria bacterium GW2011_GWC2_39_22]KKT43720.1 MAG: PAS domain S-box [Candidatus Wolfebacteria bacterium GW2011_GWE2_44_13]HBI25549.1 hypothetical protein [Candidatus Wolfebacteria bacterium]